MRIDIMRPIIGWTVVVLFALQGCSSTKRFMERGNKYYQTGQFELALQEYQQVLQREPDNVQAMEKRHRTAKQLQLWLEQLLPEAREAQQNGKAAIAMLLYRKFQQLTGDIQYGELYGQLRDQLRQQNIFRISVKADENVFKLNIPNVLINDQQASYPIHRQIGFEFSEPQFNEMKTLYEKSVPYISGTEIRDNPDYVALQQELLDRNYAVKQQRQRNYQYQQDIERYQKGISAREHRIAEFEKRRQNLQPKTPSYQQILQEIDNLRHRKKVLENKLHKITQKYYRGRNRVDDLLDIINGISYRLTIIEPVLEVDIFSDYIFVIEKHTFEARTKLHTSIASLPPAMSSVTGILMDESHEAHEQIELAADPLIKPSWEDVLHELHVALTHKAGEQVQYEFMQYLTSLKSQSEQAGFSKNAIVDWTNYGLASNTINQKESHRLSQLLHQYYGPAAEFTVNELLGLSPFLHHYRIYDY